MGVINEVINVITSFRTKGSDRMMQQKKVLHDLGEKVKTVTTRQRAANGAWRTTQRVVTSTNKVFARFRMEMLGVMFFGMAIAQLFKTMLKPAFDLVGIFELWSATLGILFLPIALALLDPLLALMDWLINVPEAGKMMIGIFALIGVILGTFLFIVGMATLGLTSLIQAFMMPGVLGALSSFWAQIGFLFSLPFLAAALILIIAFIDAFKGNFGNMQGWVEVLWESIKGVFEGFFTWLGGLWDVISGFFSGDTAKVKQGFEKMWKGIWQFVGSLKDVVVSFLVILGLTIINAFKNMVKVIVGLLVSLFHPGEARDAAVEFGKSIINSVIEGIKTGVRIAKAILAGIIPGGQTFEQASQGIPRGGIKGGRASGGFVPHDGLYRLHAGESVTPNQSISASPTININTSGGIDNATIDRIKSELGALVADGLARLSRSR